jgi:hypothetical protein
MTSVLKTILLRLVGTKGKAISWLIALIVVVAAAALGIDVQTIVDAIQAHGAAE